MNKTDGGVHAHEQKHDTERDACVTGQTLRAFANRDAPVNEEQPNAVREVPHGGGDTDHVKHKNRPHVKLTCDDVEGLTSVRRDRLIVQSGNHSIPEVETVKRDEEE